MKNENNRQVSTRELGMGLYQAQTAIYIGRQAVKEILATEPVDINALSVERYAIYESRKEVSILAAQLADTKRAQLPLLGIGIGWLK